MQKHETADGQRTPRGARAGALGAVALASLIVAGASGAQAHDGEDVRCETRLQPRAIFGRNYVVDRVTECRRVAAPQKSAEEPTALPRPAPPTGWDGAIDASLQAADWRGERRVLRNAQYDRSVRAIQGITRREVR